MLRSSGWKVALFQNADVMDVTFHGRGIDFQEEGLRPAEDNYDGYGADISKSSKRYRPDNPKNSLAKNWRVDLPKRCWCKLKRRPGEARICSAVTANTPYEHLDFAHYGCINYFAQLIFSNDVLGVHPPEVAGQLNGTVFCAITCRKAPYIERVPVVSGWDTESLCVKHNFVCLRRIEISNVASLAFDRGDPALGLASTGDILPRRSDGRYGVPCSAVLRESKCSLACCTITSSDLLT